MGIMSLIISIFTAIGAIIVPWLIMSKQNKIAIYDKRFAIYEQVIRIIEFGVDAKESINQIVDKKLTLEQLMQAYLSLWCNQDNNLYIKYKGLLNSNSSEARSEFFIEISNIIQQQCIMLSSARFLFDKKLFNYIEELRNLYRSFIGNITNAVLYAEVYSHERTEKFINFSVENQDKLKLFDKYLMLEMKNS